MRLTLVAAAVALIPMVAQARPLQSYALKDIIACPSQSAAKALLEKHGLDRNAPTEAEAAEGHCYLVEAGTTTFVDSDTVVTGEPIRMQWAGPFRKQRMWAATTDPTVFYDWERRDTYPEADMRAWE